MKVHVILAMCLLALLAHTAMSKVVPEPPESGEESTVPAKDDSQGSKEDKGKKDEDKKDGGNPGHPPRRDGGNPGHPPRRDHGESGNDDSKNKPKGCPISGQTRVKGKCVCGEGLVLQNGQCTIGIQPDK